MPKVLVLDDDVERRRMLCQGLDDAGHEVIAPQDASALNLVRLVKEFSPDVIIIDTDSPDRDTLEHICIVTRDDPRPVVMFAADGDSSTIHAAVKAGVNAYVVNGLAEERIQPILDVAIARFAQMQALREELVAARSQLEDRKSIDRAKGILMRTRDMSETQAYEALRKLAMDSSQRIVEVARQVINMRDLLESGPK
jgi:two-component system, response regulator / RNA-binding antiterminator